MQSFNVALNELRRGLLVFAPLTLLDIAMTLLLKAAYQQYLDTNFNMVISIILFLALLVVRNYSRNVSIIAYDMSTLPFMDSKLIEGRPVSQVYRIINKILQNSINKVSYEGKADISLKKSAFMKVSPILSAYVLNTHLRTSRDIESGMGDIYEYIKYSGRSILSSYKWMLILRVISVFVVGFTILLGWSVPLFWILLFVGVPLLSFLGVLIKLYIIEDVKEVEHTIPLKLDLSGTVAQIAEANPIDFEWYTGQVLADSTHVIFKKEVKNDGQSQVHRGEGASSRSGGVPSNDETSSTGSAEEAKEGPEQQEKGTTG